MILCGGFLKILKELMNIWFWDIYDNVYKIVCIFVFVVFFGGKVVFLDFKSLIIGFFFDKIYNEYKYLVFREEKKLVYDEFFD